MRYGVYLVLAMAFASLGHAQTSRDLDQPDNDRTPSQSSTDADEASEPNEERPPDGAVQHFFNALFSNLGNTPPYTDPTRYSEAERADHDLKAQRDMAFWAQGMFWVTLGSIVVTFFGVVFVYFTLKETRKATLAAGDAAGAAQDAVTVTRELGEKQIRAYVGVVAAVIEDLGVRKQPFVKIKIKNSGQSPALGLKLNTQIIVHPAHGPHPINFSPADNAIHSSGSLAAEQVTEVKARFNQRFSDDSFHALTSGEVTFVIGIYIIYSDIFKNRRRTIAKFILDNSTIKEGKGDFKVMNKGNRQS